MGARSPLQKCGLRPTCLQNLRAGGRGIPCHHWGPENTGCVVRGALAGCRPVLVRVLAAGMDAGRGVAAS